MNMKQSILFKSWLSLLTLMLPQIASAYDFMANNIAYNIVSAANNSVEVAPKTSSSAGSDGSVNYSGNVVINESVYYSGKNYTVVGIGESAFKNSFISSIKLPQTLTYIKKEAFSTCFDLTELSIPASVTQIGTSCFWMCPDLNKVYTYATTPPTCSGTNVFSYMQYNDATLYVPYGCISKYQSAYGWKDFPNFEEMAPSINGHEYVDLQLPSGNLWATTNYGATSPYSYGSYVEWSSNDVITSSWGNEWCTPTINDIKELINNCQWTWTTQNGTKGYLVKGINGNTIFLPAAGIKMGSVMNAGSWCYYWSSTPESSSMTYILLSTASSVWYGSQNTMASLPIRPIYKQTPSVVLATGISLNKSELNLEIGETETLVATVSPSNVTNGNVTWSSSNSSIATVNQNGLVTAKAVGTATISANTTDGTNLSTTCAVNVASETVLSTSITLNKSEMSLEVGDTETLVATVTPSNVTNGSVTWSSSNTGVATVDQNGKVLAKAAGTADITATTNDGTNLTATCQVTVISPPSIVENTITIGNGTVQDETVPIYNWQMGSYVGSECLYVKDQLADLKAGDKITSIAFYLVSGNAKGGNFNVRMKNTSISSLKNNADAHDTSCIEVNYNDQVNGNVTLEPYSGGQWINFPLSTPFVYNGENIIVDIRNTTPGTRSGWCYFATTTYNGVRRSLVWNIANSEDPHADGFNSGGIFGYNNTSNLPNIKITYATCVLATGISLNKPSMSLAVGDTETLVATVTPSNVTNGSVTWSSSAPSIATVDVNGKVTAVAVGTATITATTTDGSNLSASCEYTVKAAGEMPYSFMEEGIAYNINTGTQTLVITYTDKTDTYANNYLGLTAANIPATVSHEGVNYVVIGIAEHAFRNCKTLTSVSLPTTLASVNTYAFGGCEALESMTVASGNPIYDSRNNCNAIIEKSTNRLIAGCKTTVIPEDVTAIGTFAFYEHNGLETIKIPSSVTVIERSAFNHILGLKHIVVPNSVVTLEPYVFSQCYGLEEVTIGSGVTSIGMGLLYGCAAVTSLTSYIKDPTIVAMGTNVFKNMDYENCVLHVPAGTVDTYKIADQWKDFLNIVPMKYGDVNGDGHVSSVDITALYNYLLNGDNSELVNGDVDGDGHISSVDVTAVYNVLLGLTQSENEFTVNGVTFKMVPVQGGTFMMGATADEFYYDWEVPRHQVTLNSFSIGQTEVTQELWQAVMGSNMSYFTGDDNLPVDNVSWYDCQEFISKLNQITGKNFRLPTDAEWEYAARGGKNSQGFEYAGSSNIDDVAWYYNNSSLRSHPVATKQPNELGIYDMCGNMYEWCQDWFSSYSADAQTNPTGPVSGTNRVTRGGCWHDFDWDCRVSHRYRGMPDSHDQYCGFRLALQLLFIKKQDLILEIIYVVIHSHFCQST